MKSVSILGWYLLSFFVVSLFLIRGPVRAISGSSDLRGPYAAACAWRDGSNPYDSTQLKDAFIRREGSARPVQFLHPPGVIIPMLPFTWLDWQKTKVTFALLNTAAIGLLYWGLITMNPRPNRKHYNRWILLLVGLYAPIHTGIQLGQLSVSAIAFGVAGIAVITRHRSILAGFLIGLSFTLKPQIGLVMVVYLGFTGRWKALAMTILVCLIPLIVSSWGLSAAGYSFSDVRASWQQSLSETNSVKGGERFTSSNKARANLLNLHVFLHGFIKDLRLVSIAAPSIVLALCLVWWCLYLSRWQDCPEAVCVSIPLILSLLIIYHRTYDAILLLVPLSWAMAGGKAIPKLSSVTVVSSTLAFVVPGGAVISWLQTRGRLPESVLSSPLWEKLVVPHGSLMLVVCAFGLFVAMFHSPTHKSITASEKRDCAQS